MPKPADLPPTADWLANSVGDMHSVSDEEVDIVFSGQNIEHLWPEDITNFLLEAYRVLRPSGWLIIDSPNRLITSPLNYIHSEHVIELTPGEATELLRRAGFTGISIRGLWVCRDRLTGDLLPLDPHDGGPNWPILRRVMEAADRPDDSFVWWAEAQKSDVRPDCAALRDYVAEIAGPAWSERVQRLSTNIGAKRFQGGKCFVCAAVGESGFLIYGPFIPMKPGLYRVTFTLASDTTNIGEEEEIGCADICIAQPIVTSPLKAGQFAHDDEVPISLEFTLQDTAFGVQFRIISNGRAALQAELNVRLEKIAPLPLGEDLLHSN